MSYTEEQVITTTTKTKTTVKLDTRVQKQLRTELDTYQRLKSQVDQLKAGMDSARARVAQIMEDADEMTALIDGIKIGDVKVKMISPIRKKLNHKKLVELGCAVAWIEEATEHVPGNDYVRITLPGAHDDEE